MTAIRETFEETGLLLASSESGSRPSDKELDEAREQVHSQRLLFRDFLAKHKLSADTSSLLPFTQWITPPGQPRHDGRDTSCVILADLVLSGGSKPSFTSHSLTLRPPQAFRPVTRSSGCPNPMADRKLSLPGSSTLPTSYANARRNRSR